MQHHLVLACILGCFGGISVVFAQTEHHHHDGGGGHGHHHGMVVPESKNFPTLAYDDRRTQEPPQIKSSSGLTGDAKRGRTLAYDAGKGRCLSCHVLGADGEQPGTVGPNLSTYATRKISSANTFQQIWDSRTRNPDSIMPPFGTFGLLNTQEVADITAYLHTLTTPVDSPVAMRVDSRGVWITGEDLTRADVYLEQGAELFQQPGKNSKSCASCHHSGGEGPDLKRVAVTYPKWNSRHESIMLLEQRINMCRRHRMDSEVYPLGSTESNLLLSYVKYLARHQLIHVATDGPAVQAIERGRQSFYRRTGQLNFACATCHAPDRPVVGKWLRGDVTQSMLPGGGYQNLAAQWPKHFIGGHDLGLQSLQQRIEHCQAVTRSMPLRLGSEEYIDLELFITANANGATLLAPTITRLRGEE